MCTPRSGRSWLQQSWVFIASSSAHLWCPCNARVNKTHTLDSFSGSVRYVQTHPGNVMTKLCHVIFVLYSLTQSPLSLTERRERKTPNSKHCDIIAPCCCLPTGRPMLSNMLTRANFSVKVALKRRESGGGVSHTSFSACLMYLDYREAGLLCQLISRDHREANTDTPTNNHPTATRACLD